jgi:hypothetical protein
MDEDGDADFGLRRVDEEKQQQVRRQERNTYMRDYRAFKRIMISDDQSEEAVMMINLNVEQADDQKSADRLAARRRERAAYMRRYRLERPRTDSVKRRIIEANRDEDMLAAQSDDEAPLAAYAGDEDLAGDQVLAVKKSRDQAAYKREYNKRPEVVAKNRQYRLEHADERAFHVRQHRADDPEAYAIYERQRRAGHPDADEQRRRRADYERQRRAEHPDADEQRRRRADFERQRRAEHPDADEQRMLDIVS